VACLPAAHRAARRRQATPAAARQNIDILPEGRFVGTIAADAATTGDAERLEVAQHWFEELKGKVP
jgi:hypothetical protein